MPAPLPAPHVPLGFSPLVVVGGLTTHPCSPTEPETEAGSQTGSPGGQTTLGTKANDQIAPHTEVGGQTNTLGGPTTRTCATPSSPASLTWAAPRAAPTTSATPHALPSTPPAPRVTPASTTMVAPPTALEPYPLHYSRHPRAAPEPPAPPLH
jgi:hypothetical protein